MTPSSVKLESAVEVEIKVSTARREDARVTVQSICEEDITGLSDTAKRGLLDR
jgi:hypothetical protein